VNEINYELLKKVHQLKPVIRTQIIGIGSYLPKKRVKSDDIMEYIDTEKLYDTPYNWMSEKMGIIERRMCEDNQLPSDLAVSASIDAFEANPSFDPALIDAVIFCGIEHDKQEPATAHIIQNKLGLKANHVFDVSNACFGFIDGLKIASALIESETIKHALIVTGEVSTQMTRAVADILKKGVDTKEAINMWGMLSLGDAGGAVIVGPSEDGNSGFMSFNQRSESRHVDLCNYKWERDGTVSARMQMARIVSRGFELNKKIFQETLNGLGWSSVDWAVAHQTGDATFKQTLGLHSLHEKKVVKTYPLLGNITTATLPVSFKKLFESGNVTKGHRIGGLFAGSGLVAGQFGYIA